MFNVALQANYYAQVRPVTIISHNEATKNISQLAPPESYRTERVLLSVKLK